MLASRRLLWRRLFGVQPDKTSMSRVSVYRFYGLLLFRSIFPCGNRGSTLDAAHNKRGPIKNQFRRVENLRQYPATWNAQNDCRARDGFGRCAGARWTPPEFV